MGVAVYARVSTIRQAQSKTIEQQLDRLRAAVAERGWELRDSTRNQTRSHSRAASSTGRHSPCRAFRPTAMRGVPASQPSALNSLFKRGVNADGAAGAPSPCRAVVVSGAAPGTTYGNHRANYPRHLGASSGTVSAAQMHE